MRFVTCGVCGNEKSAVNSSLVVDDVVCCENCLKEKFPNDEALNGKKVVKDFDPTVCVHCAKDFGDFQLKLYGSYPMCDECRQATEEKIFPTWVKGFFAGVIALVLFSLVWNWRFIEAYYQLKKVDTVLTYGSLDQVGDLYAEISSNLPEVHELKQVSNYYKGIKLLGEDKGEEALDLLSTCTELPQNYGVPVLTLQAQISVSFNKKNYQEFVNSAKQYLTYDTSSVSLAQLASAYACLYAEQKSDSTKAMALEYLNRAINTQDTTRFLAEYVNRIEHRLATGEIMDKAAFDSKYPNGWTK